MSEAGRRLRGAVWVALVLAFVALPVRAALFDDEEARRRIADTQVRLTNVQNQLEARLAAIEGQLKNQGLVDLLSHVEQLKTDVARLRGQIEVLINEQDQLQKRQRDLYIDLDSRLRRLEGGPGANVPPASGRAPGVPSAAASPGAAAPQPLALRRASRRLLPPARPTPGSSSAPTTSRSINSRRPTIPGPSRASTRSSRPIPRARWRRQPTTGSAIRSSRSGTIRGLSPRSGSSSSPFRAMQKSPTRCSISPRASSKWAMPRRRGARSRN